MTSPEPKYDKEEFAQRGDHMYECTVEPHLSAEDVGKFVALDIDSGDFAISADEQEAADLLRARKPQAQVWLQRAGSRYARRFGGHSKPGAR